MSSSDDAINHLSLIVVILLIDQVWLLRRLKTAQGMSFGFQNRLVEWPLESEISEIRQVFLEILRAVGVDHLSELEVNAIHVNEL